MIPLSLDYVRGKVRRIRDVTDLKYLQAFSYGGGHSKWDLRYTQKPMYLPVLTNNIWSYLLWPPVALDDEVGIDCIFPGCAENIRLARVPYERFYRLNYFSGDNATCRIIIYTKCVYTICKYITYVNKKNVWETPPNPAPSSSRHGFHIVGVSWVPR